MRVLFLALAATVSFTCFAQEIIRKEVDLEKLVDELLAGQDEDFNYEELYENLALLLAQPADLNQVTAEQLRALYILSETQIQRGHSFHYMSCNPFRNWIGKHLSG